MPRKNLSKDQWAAIHLKDGERNGRQPANLKEVNAQRSAHQHNGYTLPQRKRHEAHLLLREGAPPQR
jgi:hypothetical protein